LLSIAEEKRAMRTTEDNLVKAAGSPTLYVVESGELRPIPDTATMLSKGNWGQVQTVPDSDVEATPLGEPIPSVIQPPAYSRGTLLASPLEEQLYVIEDGGRKLIPDAHTFEVKGYSPDSIEYVPPELLDAIPLVGVLSLEEATPINTGGSLYTFLGAGHQMWTGATLWRDSGHLQATTRTRTYTAFGGFTGGAQVILVGQNGTMLANTGVHSFGVDGTWVGRSDRTDSWSEQVDQSRAAQATSLAVVHAWTPKVSLYEMVRRAVEIGKIIWDFIKELFARGDAGGAQGPVYSLP
jgi:hypothetical protein